MFFWIYQSLGCSATVFLEAVLNRPIAMGRRCFMP